MIHIFFFRRSCSEVLSSDIQPLVMFMYYSMNTKKLVGKVCSRKVRNVMWVNGFWLNIAVIIQWTTTTNIIIPAAPFPISLNSSVLLGWHSDQSSHKSMTDFILVIFFFFWHTSDSMKCRTMRVLTRADCGEERPTTLMCGMPSIHVSGSQTDHCCLLSMLHLLIWNDALGDACNAFTSARRASVLEYNKERVLQNDRYLF